jgi:cell division protease FtsH
MIFGEEFTSSGVYSDIEEASRLANKAVRNYAMGSDPIHLAVGTQNEDAFIMSQKYSAESVVIIKACQAEAERILRKNKLLLLKMADYLTTHSRMEEQMILNYVRQFSTETWIESEGFLNRGEYYQFNTILQSQLLEEEKKNFSLVIERMVIASEATNM